MTDTEAWDRIAGRRTPGVIDGVVHYGAHAPTEEALRLCGNVRGKRVLDLGSGAGENAVTFAQQGAHVTAIDASAAMLALGKALAARAEVRIEWHQGDVAELAFLRADSIDLAFSSGVLAHVEDVDRLFRQVHRVLRPGAAFVCASEHPMALCVGRDDAGPGALPLGRLEVRRSYFDPGPATVVHEGEQLTVWPRTIAAIYSALHRAGFRVDVLLEPEPVHSADPGPAVPDTLVWRARKEGV